MKMSSRKTEGEDHCLEMTDSPSIHLNHQQLRESTDQLTVLQTQSANSGYDSDLAEFARTDPNRPGGPYSSGPVKHDPLPPPQGKFYFFVHNTQNQIYNLWERYKKLIKRIVLLILLIGYFVYLGFAIHTSIKDATGLIVGTVVLCLYFIYKTLFEEHWQSCRVPCCHWEWWQVSRIRIIVITVTKW